MIFLLYLTNYEFFGLDTLLNQVLTNSYDSQGVNPRSGKGRYRSSDKIYR